MSFRLLSCVLLFAETVLGAVHRRGLGHRSSYSTFVRALDFNQKLRVCNAYPYDAPMEIYHGKDKLSNEALPYKRCEQFGTKLKAGDKIDFRVLGSMAGTFTISDLPENDAILILLIHRHDTMSTAVSFESHVFANVKNAQVAVLDTYRGSEKSTLKIQDVKGQQSSRSEELRYNSVVAVNPGQYEVLLTDGSKEVDTARLTALNKESYVVLRVGVEAQQGQKFPQEILVYPQSDPAGLRSAAHSHLADSLVLFATLLGFCLY